MSPDPQDRLESYRQDKGFTFPMLMDPDLAIVKEYGILNEDNPRVPHPAAIIVDRRGTATYVRVDEDYRVRPPTAAELLPELEKLQ